MEWTVSVLGFSWHFSEAFTPFKGVLDGFSEAHHVAYLVSADLYLGFPTTQIWPDWSVKPCMGLLITLIRWHLSNPMRDSIDTIAIGRPLLSPGNALVDRDLLSKHIREGVNSIVQQKPFQWSEWSREIIVLFLLFLYYCYFSIWARVYAMSELPLFDRAFASWVFMWSSHIIPMTGMRNFVDYFDFLIFLFLVCEIPLAITFSVASHLIYLRKVLPFHLPPSWIFIGLLQLFC